MTRKGSYVLAALSAALLATASAGCGNPAIVGRWQTMVNNVGIDVLFFQNRTLVESVVTVFPPNSPVFPGCTQMVQFGNLTWRTDDKGDQEAVAVDASQVAALETRMGCMNPADDVAQPQPLAAGGPPVLPVGSTTYDINDQNTAAVLQTNINGTVQPVTYMRH
jgi:hypothetical protein